MGVIAEELSLALQLPGKEGEPVKPDWPSGLNKTSRLNETSR